MGNNETVELPQELCEYFQKISENDPVSYLSKMIAPHLVGKEWETIRKTALLSLASYGLQKTKKKRRIHLLLLGLPGTGKSVDENTPVIIKKESTIKILKIKDTEKIAGFKALSVNPSTLKTEWKDVYKVSKHQERRKVLRITTIGKQEVTATQDHSFLKYDFAKDRLMPVKGCDLKIGDLIPFIAEIPTHNRFENGDFDFGFAVGFWLADGDINEVKKQTHIRFSSSEKNILIYIKTTLKNIEGAHHSYKGGTVYKTDTGYGLSVSEKSLLEYLYNFVTPEYFQRFGKGKSCYTKTIPSFCYQSSNSFVRGLLCGYFTGDGTVGKEGISATTASLSLAQGIRLLLWKLKIGCYIRKDNKKTGIYHDIIIPSYYSEVFSEKIGFKNNKQIILNQKLKKKRYNATVNIPFSSELYKKTMIKNLSARRSKNRRFIHNIRKGGNKNRLTKGTAKKYNKLVKSPVIKKLIDSNLYWAPIKKIDKHYLSSKEYVYDFSVKDNENFVLANGMVVHNTELLLWTQDNLQGVMVNSENTSKAGLVGDARGGEITPGLLAELDGNFVLLDELDKMSTQDANGLLQAMEEGSYKIIKGKHRQKFQAEIRVIASANEVKKIQPPLLDRFDFIYHCTTSTREDRAKNVPRITASFFGDNDEKNASILNGYMIWLGDTTPSAFEDKKTIDIYIANYIKKVKEVDVTRASYRFLEMSIMRIAWAIAKLHKREVITPKDVEDAVVFKHDTMRRVYGINIKKEG